MRRENGHAGYRHARLEEVLFEELVSLLRDCVSDPAASCARVMSVSLSADYRHARVHVLGESRSFDCRAVEEALVRATPYLRHQLAAELDLKRTPDLRFVCDAVVVDDEEGLP